MAPRKDLPTGAALTCEAAGGRAGHLRLHGDGVPRAHRADCGGDCNDPCHSPWAWREGELCGPPRTTFTMRFIMEGTSLPQPKLLDDYTHLLLRRPE